MEVSRINTQCTAIIFIRLLLSTTNFPEAKLSSTFLSPIFWKIFKDHPPTTRKYSKTFHQQPENIQNLFRLQNCLNRKSSTTREYSKTFWAINSSHQQQQSTAATNKQQSTAATNSSNQQQQSTAAISNSNQQQQPATAINSSNQKQHSTTTINCSNNQLSTYQHHLHNPRRPMLDTITVPSSGYVLLEVDLGLATRLRVHLPPLPRFLL